MIISYGRLLGMIFNSMPNCLLVVRLGIEHLFIDTDLEVRNSHPPVIHGSVLLSFTSYFKVCIAASEIRVPVAHMSSNARKYTTS